MRIRNEFVSGKYHRLWPGLCLGLGLLLLGGGLGLPAYLRAVDSRVVRSAGQTGDSLLGRGQALMDAGRLGAAHVFVAAAQLARMPGWEPLGESLTNRLRRNPPALYWGNERRLPTLFPRAPADAPFAAFIVQKSNREAALARLDGSLSFLAQELMRCRTLSQTVLFPPSSSAAGQALDAVLAECGLLAEANQLTPALSSQIRELAEQANHGASSQPLEQVLLDLGSLGERLNWDQLTALLIKVPDAGTLHVLAAQLRQAGDRWPLWFAAVQLSGQPAAVAAYVTQFPETGLRDLTTCLWQGENGLRQLTRTSQRLYPANRLQQVLAKTLFGWLYAQAAESYRSHPWLVLIDKWLCFLAAGFCLATSWQGYRQAGVRPEQPLQIERVHLVRNGLFSAGFLLVVLLLSEPYLAQDPPVGATAFRLHLPMAGAAMPSVIPSTPSPLMNTNSQWNPTLLLTILVFFILQGILYVTCLAKLAEIRRQPIPPRMKLKLLENEDHLFDAGLYVGFAGTIVSLILASLGMVKFSLMAAYSSTCFGILFVVIFKICHLRPARRALLLESDPAAPPTSAAAPTPASPV